MRTNAVGGLNALMEVTLERARQDRLWGTQNHDPFKWLSILGEEVGEANKAANDAHDWKDSMGNKRWGDLKNYRTELIQVAAVAVSMVECLDRGLWK